MCTRKVAGIVCKKLYEIPTRVIGTLLTIAQGILLNFFLAAHYGVLWHCWIIMDAVIVAVFITAYVVSYRSKKPADDGDASVLQHSYPLVFISWTIYSIGYIARVAIIYSNFVWKLERDTGLSPNLLRVTLSLSAPIFFFLLTAHYGHKTKKQYIDELTGTVPLDVLDSIQILNVLIMEESRVMLPLQMDRAIIAVSCLNVIIPVVPLFTLNLNESRPAHKQFTERVFIVHKLVHMLVINIPLSILRIFLWHSQAHDVSVFLMKNAFMIYLTLHSVITYLWKRPVTPGKTETIEMDVHT